MVSNCLNDWMIILSCWKQINKLIFYIWCALRHHKKNIYAIGIWWWAATVSLVGVSNNPSIVILVFVECCWDNKSRVVIIGKATGQVLSQLMRQKVKCCLNWKDNKLSVVKMRPHYLLPLFLVSSDLNVVISQSDYCSISSQHTLCLYQVALELKLQEQIL